MSPALSQTRQWLWDNIPADDKGPSLLHGDVGFHNILFDEDRITALLDWELTFLGHPAKDLAQLHNMVVAHLPWDRFMGWYRSAGGEAVAQRAILYFQRSEEHTSELQSLMRISYAVFCLKKKKTNTHRLNTQ